MLYGGVGGDLLFSCLMMPLKLRKWSSNIVTCLVLVIVPVLFGLVIGKEVREICERPCDHSHLSWMITSWIDGGLASHLVWLVLGVVTIALALLSRYRSASLTLGLFMCFFLMRTAPSFCDPCQDLPPPDRLTEQKNK